MTIYVLHPETDRMIRVDECFIIQDSELSADEDMVMNDGLIPQSVLNKSTHLPQVIAHYMGVKK
jgi:hypothetical protein